MNITIKSLRTKPEEHCAEIEAFIEDKAKSLKREGAVIGLSGGLDSATAAMLTVRSLGKEKVHLLYLPERDSNPLHRKHARQLAQQLGIKLTIINLAPMLRAARTYRVLPLPPGPWRKLRAWLVDYGRRKLVRHNDGRILGDRLRPEGDSWMARGNAYGMSKHRARMLQVYQYAEVRNLMVVGAANRTEWLTGTFCHWGVDHCADIMPLLHLFRSQLEDLAEYIQVPDYIRDKTPDPDLYPTQIDKGAYLGGFQIADSILYNLEQDVGKKILYEAYDKEIVDRLHNLMEASQHMRMCPYHL